MRKETATSVPKAGETHRAIWEYRYFFAGPAVLIPIQS
jgi:hypothetical protein